MNKYVKVKYRGKIYSSYLHYVDENYQWSADKIESENSKSVNIAKMAFLDHGTPLIPLDILPSVLEQKAAYLTPTKGVVFLIYESGSFMTLIPGMEIIEEVYSEYYPIEKEAAIVCENDPFDRYHGGLDYIFTHLAKLGGASTFHYMFNFRSRTEAEVIDAFKKTPAIIFYSTHTDMDWFELMIRCIIKSKTKAKVIGKKNNDADIGANFDKCVELAAKFGVEIIVS